MYKYLKTGNYYAIIACFLWSTAFAGIKIGLEYSTPLRFAGIRFMMAGLMILPLCVKELSTIKILWQHSSKVFFISLFQTIGLYTLFYQGIHRVPAAVTAMIIGSSPLFIALMAHIALRADKLHKRKLWALVIGFVGIVLIAMTKKMENPKETATMYLGIIMLLMANISGSFGNVLISKFKVPVSPLLLNSVQIFFGGLIIYIISLFVEGAHLSFEKPPTYYLSLFWLSFISAAAFSIWFTLLQRKDIRVSEINVWKFMIPVLGSIISWVLIDDEHPELYSILGMGFIGLSIFIMYSKALQKPKYH